MLHSCVSVVVGSKYRDIFDQCRRAVERHLPSLPKIVVVDDPGSWDVPGWRVVGVLPMGADRPEGSGMVAAVMNTGARACAPHDMLWLQDDVTVESPELVEALQNAAYSFPKAGPVAPRVRGVVGNQEQASPCAEGVVESPQFLCFMCVYFRRDLLEKVGPFDESFRGYGADDVDWCRRATQAGYKMVVARSVAVVHGFGEDEYASTFRRNDPKFGETCGVASEMLREKWER